MNNIQKIRKEKGITQKELSEITGIPKRTLEDWEAARVKTSDVYKLHRIAKALGCEIADLIDLDAEI